MIEYRPGEEAYDQALEKFGKKIPLYGWLAGGALRAFFAHEQVKDLDLFFAEAESVESAKECFLDAGWSIVVDNATVLRMTRYRSSLDLVRMLFESPEKTLENFDFTVACAALSHEKLIVHDRFWFDLAARRLTVNALPFPTASLVRLQRFAGRGYRACPETIRQMALAFIGRTAEQINGEHLYHAVD